MADKDVTSEMVISFHKYLARSEAVPLTVIHMDNLESYGLYVPDNKE